MEDWLLYLLRSAGVLAVFYLFYKVLLSRETFHRFNRAVLLLSTVLAALLPLCRITCYREVAMAVPDVMQTPLSQPVAAVQDVPADTVSWIDAVGRIYLCGVAVCLFYGFVSAGAIVRLLREGRSYSFGRHGVRLVLHGRREAPFSWIRWIVLSEHDFRTAARPIVTHECAHLRSGHSWDLVVTDLLGAVQWFNPAMWLVRAELRAIHEYEADAAVLRSGADAREYQLLLIKKAVGARWCSVANSFNHSKLKNRITMMLREKSSARTALRALYLVPLTGFALGAFARTVTVPVYSADKVSEISALVQAPEPEKTAAEAAAYPESRVESGAATPEVGSADSAVSVPTEKKTLKKVSGMVRADGTPLIGAQVRVSGQKRGTVTDAEGRFSMDAARGDVLEVSYVGFKTGQVKVDDPDRPVNVDLVAEDTHPAVADTVIMVSKARDGMTVITTTTKSSETADPSKPKYESKTVVTVNSGRAGDSESVVYIVDGKEVGTIEDLDPGQIKSITILKNPEAIAKYGERARDGVIVITTKQSKTADPADPKIKSTTVTTVKFGRGLDSKSVVYIVDGKEVGTIEDLDPDRIKSISVQKNTEAIAEYGERARDGVIVITTKPSESADPAGSKIKSTTVVTMTPSRGGNADSAVNIVDGEPFIVVEQMPSFQGGDLNAFLNWVQKNVRYPQIAQKNGISGKVIVNFVIERDGSLTNIKVLNTPDKSLTEEAIRVLKLSPKWTPGRQDGNPVRVSFNLPIDFSIRQ